MQLGLSTHEKMEGKVDPPRNLDLERKDGQIAAKHFAWRDKNSASLPP